VSAPQQHQDALRAVVLRLLELDVRGHTLADRLQFTPAGRAILEQARSALAGQAAVHAEPVPPVVTDVLAELAKAVAKFPTWPTDRCTRWLCSARSSAS